MIPRRNRIPSSDMGVFLRLRATHYPSLSVKVFRTEKPFARIAIVVSKRVAPRSVDRSLIKRILYSAITSHLDALVGFDIVFMAKTKDKLGLVSDVGLFISQLRTS